jgi:ribosomal protein S18 acetylase RimI-like enzyme
MTTAMIRLIPITPEHADAFKRTRLAALSESPQAFGSTHAREVLLTDEQWHERASKWTSSNAVAYLAWDDRVDDACGIVAGLRDADDPSVGHLMSMWVAPSHRRCGLGRMLVQAVIDWATSMGLTSVRLSVTSGNDTAIALYVRMGFVATGKTSPYPNDPAFWEIEMSRPTGSNA